MEPAQDPPFLHNVNKDVELWASAPSIDLGFPKPNVQKQYKSFHTLSLNTTSEKASAYGWWKSQIIANNNNTKQPQNDQDLQDTSKILIQSPRGPNALKRERDYGSAGFQPEHLDGLPQNIRTHSRHTRSASDATTAIIFNKLDETDREISGSERKTKKLKMKNPGNSGRKSLSMSQLSLSKTNRDPTESPEPLESPDLKLVLPCVPKQGYNVITVKVLTELMDGEFSNQLDRVVVIDCRYPYEYEGGHVKGAVNLFTESMVKSYLMDNAQYLDRVAFVFHCEFSSKRAPGLYHFLRRWDRAVNIAGWPHQLYYPEMYLLEGGYKKVWSENRALCEPDAYVTMFDDRFGSERRKYISSSRQLKRSVSENYLASYSS
eukprot:TRINITY_DN14761_c0_g1_i1.p1 TRINITY_DN14761_c0_g1~~TRINITY_DN14761_c0_g1_i1.p1  ORF type:complete len:376 (+),score=51.66 TRINITY_DN14761_c0_g1_i1:149-1276(+)